MEGNLDLQPHFEVSCDPVIKLDLFLAPPNTSPYPPEWPVARDPDELMLEVRGVAMVNILAGTGDPSPRKPISSWDSPVDLDHVELCR